jgi:mono/diheme cytochrome c family protein
MLHSRSRRGDRRRNRRIPDPNRGRLPGSRRSDREISIEVSDDEEDQQSQSSFPGIRFLNRLGPKERFLAFGVLFALVITLSVIYYDRHFDDAEPGADPNNQAQVSLGQSLYNANCAFCHGDKLEGKADWDQAYPNGGRPALPLSGEGAITRLSDQDLMDVTKYGGQPFSPADYKNDMPGFEMQLSDGDIWAILAYIKSRWPETAIERQREAMEQSGQ